MYILTKFTRKHLFYLYLNNKSKLSLENIIIQILNIKNSHLKKFSLKSFIEVNKLFMKYLGIIVAERTLNKIKI